MKFLPWILLGAGVVGVAVYLIMKNMNKGTKEVTTAPVPNPAPTTIPGPGGFAPVGGKTDLTGSVTKTNPGFKF